MDRWIALGTFIAALAGCEPQRETLVHRNVDNGVEKLHARAAVEAGVARFECVQSASGECRWVLHAGAMPREVRVAAGDSRQIAVIARARVCVADAAASACHRF